MADWGDVPTWVSAGIAVASAAWASVSAIASRRARAEADRLAQDAAEAAVRSAEAESRAATAIERLASTHEERSRIEAVKRDAAASRPPWSLQRRDQFNVALRNGSDAPRFGVTATGEQVRVPGGFTWEQVAAGSEVQFHMIGGDDTTPDVEVTWHDTDDDTGPLRTWRGLPG